MSLDEVCSLAALEAHNGIDEELVPEEGEARGHSGLQETRGESLKITPEPFLSADPHHTVHKPMICAHLHRKYKKTISHFGVSKSKVLGQ